MCIVPFNFKPFWFTLTLLAVYSKAELKNDGDKASPCFKAFLIGNMSDKCLLSRTPLQISFRRTFISLTSFMGIPDSMRMFYKTSLLTKS